MKGKMQQSDTRLTPLSQAVGAAGRRGVAEDAQGLGRDRTAVESDDSCNGAHELYLDLSVCLDPREAPRWRLYTIAGLRLACNINLPDFEPFRLAQAPVIAPPEPPLPATAPATQPVCQTTGWLAGAQRAVALHPLEPWGQWLEIAGIGDFVLNGASGQIRCVRMIDGVGRGALEEAALGPPLALTLAQRAIWSMHGAAFEHRGKAILLSGRSGSGKSTLAQYCSHAPGLRRLADDILPCSLDEDSVHVRPHFPQPKLPHEAQFGSANPPLIPLGMLLFLEPVPATEPPQLIRLPLAHAIKRIAEQSVALRLFEPDLRMRHLVFSTTLWEKVTIFLLSYPHRRDSLPGVIELITEADA